MGCYMGFPKIRDTILGSLQYGLHDFGVHLGVPLFREPTIYGLYKPRP